jgi:regulator of protease activity HflC (stomatin/prohibitin superfamily)
MHEEEEAPPTWRERLRDWLNRVQFVVYLLLVLLLLTIGFLWNRMFIVIPAGFRGVMYRTVQGGTVTERIWNEGLHVIPPWDKLTPYEVRLTQHTVKFNVLSDEGLSLGVQVVVRHRPEEDMLGYLQRDIGPDYFDRLIKPEVEAHIRRTFGGRPAHEIYASVRDVLQEMGQFPLIGRAEKTDKGMVSRPYLYVQELRLISVELPKIVEDAILEKYHQEQLMLAYRYKLEREEKEADRKRTEAAGIRDFNQIAGKISPDMLKWRSIDASLELAKSPNSKVVVLGGGQGGMSMQLNLGDAPPPAAAREAAPTEATPPVAAPVPAKPLAPKVEPAKPKPAAPIVGAVPKPKA